MDCIAESLAEAVTCPDRPGLEGTGEEGRKAEQVRFPWKKKYLSRGADFPPLER